jgi:chemotaxis protein MotB
MARKKKHEEHVNHERWLVSYADFVTLLFATFTALFAISNADKEKFAAMAKSLKNSFSTDVPTDVKTIGLKGRGLKEHTKTPFLRDLFPQMKKSEGRGSSDTGTEPDGESAQGEETNVGLPDHVGQHGSILDEPGEIDGIPHTEGTAPAPGDGKGQTDLKGWVPKVEQGVEQVIQGSQLGQALNVRKDRRGLVISLSEAAFFEPESPFVKPESVPKLDKLFDFLKKEKLRLRIEAHMDDSPMTNGRFESSWDLTAARASKLLQHMIANYEFPPELISAAGFGSAHPIDSNATELGRSRNRRVDLVIEGPEET